MELPAEIPVTVAGLGLIRVAVGNSNGTSNLILQGLARIELDKAVGYKPYRRHRFRLLNPSKKSTKSVRELKEKLIDLVFRRLKKGSQLPIHIFENLEAASAVDFKKVSPTSSLQDALAEMVKLTDAEQFADLVSCTMLSEPKERQILLETVELDIRFKNLISFLRAEMVQDQIDG